MKIPFNVIVLVVVYTVEWRQAAALPSGAPANACLSMSPNHPNVKAKTSLVPYRITASTNRIKAGHELSVAIEGIAPPDTFRGILLEAREWINGTMGTEPLGEFLVSPTNPQIRTLQCGNNPRVYRTISKYAGAHCWGFGE